MNFWKSKFKKNKKNSNHSTDDAVGHGKSASNNKKYKKSSDKKSKKSKFNRNHNNNNNNNSSSGHAANNHSGGGGKKIKKKFVIEVKGPNDELKAKYTQHDVLAYELPLIRNYVNDVEKRKLSVTRKLRLCSVIYNFGELLQTQNEAIIFRASNSKNGVSIKRNDAMTDAIEKQMRGIEKKRQMLVEIVEFISTQTWWNEDILQELIACIHRNLFRTLPTKGERKIVKGDEEEEPFQDPAWLHLQLVYELCLRFLIANDINKKIMQKYLHGKFVLNLIQLFQSEDLRERDYLKTILHRIYGRFMPLRLQIRTEIANECYRYVYASTRKVHGIAEFLDIFSSIINGFSIPVKDEHKAFLRNVLIPLHKCKKYDLYFQQLADCCVLFVNKEQTIATTVLGGLLKFWPHSSPTKEAFYLREMLNVIGALVEHENGFNYLQYKDILLLCVQQIFSCMISPHFQVAEQAMTLWKDTVMLYISKMEKEIIWRRLFIIFKINSETHWNQGLKVLTTEVIQYYERIDYAYWKELQDEYQNSKNDTSAATATTVGETEADTEADADNHGSNSGKKQPLSKPKTLNPIIFNETLQAMQLKQHNLRTKQWQRLREVAEVAKENMDYTYTTTSAHPNTNTNTDTDNNNNNNGEGEGDENDALSDDSKENSESVYVPEVTSSDDNNNDNNHNSNPVSDVPIANGHHHKTKNQDNTNVSVT